MAEIIVEFPSPLTEQEQKFIYGYKGELVRCKDCKLFDPEHEGGIGSCGLDMNVTANDYCSKAERKESEECPTNLT